MESEDLENHKGSLSLPSVWCPFRSPRQTRDSQGRGAGGRAESKLSIFLPLSGWVPTLPSRPHPGSQIPRRSGALWVCEKAKLGHSTCFLDYQLSKVIHSPRPSHWPEELHAGWNNNGLDWVFGAGRPKQPCETERSLRVTNIY